MPENNFKDANEMMKEVHNRGAEFGMWAHNLLPDNMAKTQTLLKIQEAVMWANQCIARDEVAKREKTTEEGGD